MNRLRKLALKYRSAHWLLVAAILLISLIPAHYHLHHICGTEVTSQIQSIDLHLLSDADEQSHHGIDTTVITISPDTLVKDTDSSNVLLALLTVFLLLLVLLHLHSMLRFSLDKKNLNQLFYYLTPPLRAPPQY